MPRTIPSDRVSQLIAAATEVFIAPKANPSNGASADRYAEILQEKLDRPIMTKLDAEEAQRKGVREGEQLAARLITE